MEKRFIDIVAIQMETCGNLKSHFEVCEGFLLRLIPVIANLSTHKHPSAAELATDQNRLLERCRSSLKSLSKIQSLLADPEFMASPLEKRLKTIEAFGPGLDRHANRIAELSSETTAMIAACDRATNELEQPTVPADYAVTPLFIKLMFYYYFNNGIEGMYEADIPSCYDGETVTEWTQRAVDLGFIIPAIGIPNKRYIITDLGMAYVNRILNTPFSEQETK